MTGIVKAFFVIIFVVLLFPLLLVFIEKKLKVHFLFYSVFFKICFNTKRQKHFAETYICNEFYEFLSLYRLIFILCCFLESLMWPYLV